MPMGMGFGLPVTGRVALGPQQLFSLFANGEDGFLCGNWSELDELFTTAAGPTAVAADTDPVGLALDDRAWSVRTLAQQLAQATELLVPGSWTMGTAPGSGTATEAPSGQLNLTGDGTNQSRGDQSFATVVGRTYRLAGTVAGNTVLAFVGTSQGGSEVTSQTWAAGASYSFYFVATATTTWVRVLRSSAGTAVATSLSCKAVSGNHALQATTTQRPLWRANSGKPYLSFDGSDDRLVTPFVPTAVLTMAVAARWTNANTMALGGGHSAGGIRAFLGLDASGFLNIGWGGSLSQGSVDRRNSDFVAIVTGGFNDMTAYVDGAQVLSSSISGGPGGGGPVAIGAYNNNGTPQSFMAGNIYAALALNRWATPAEIGLITRQFQRTYQ